MKQRRWTVLTVVAVALSALTCGGGSSTTPTTPSVAAPAGCSGTPINGVLIMVGAAEGNVTVQFGGKTSTQQITPGGTPINVTEDLVPCTYEVSAQLTNSKASRLDIGFGRNVGPGKTVIPGGVQGSSIVVLEGGANTGNSSCRYSTLCPTGSCSAKLQFKVVDSSEGACTSN